MEKCNGKLKIVIGFVALTTCTFIQKVNAQTETEKSLGSQVHTFSSVYDSTYGIEVYDKLNPITEGDSTRRISKTELCNSEVQDYYPDGKLLHKGFYVDGKLTLYTNYYPNGTTEREFKLVTERKNEMKKYFMDGKLKSEKLYFEGTTISWKDYYENGQLSYEEEYTKDDHKLLKRFSYFNDGKPELIFQPVDSDKHGLRYSHREFYSNGKIKEEFQMLYNSDSSDFIKDGDDKEYDENGTLTAENNYLSGSLNETIK